MIHKTLSIAYSFKNFKNHMGITDSITLFGMLRRYTRKYPKTFNALKKGSVLAILYYSMMAFVPGNNLPFQKNIKLSMYASTRIITKAWFYNIIAPQPQEYLIKLNELILSALDNQLYDIDFLQRYFREIEELVKEQRGQLKANSYMDLLLYSEIILQNIIRYQKPLLLQQSIINHYEWVYSTVLEKLYACKITNKEEKHIKLVYPLIQYILSYATPQTQYKCIHLYYQMTKKKDKESGDENNFRYKLMNQAIKQSIFTTTLKNIYNKTQDSETKKEIVHIFEEINKVYQRNVKGSLTD